MRNAGLEETQAGIKIARKNINNLRYADNTTLMAESEDSQSYLTLSDSMPQPTRLHRPWDFPGSVPKRVAVAFSISAI